MSSFLVADTLVVNTQSSGQCCIELCQGDITQLDIKDKVDVLCVSVFRNTYSLSSHTLVGALNDKLNLNIQQLAEDKEEDLRHAYMCWWSKPLAENIPFRKLLCFENRGRACRPQELVANVFRCLVPILNNEPGTAITPLLNTGGQGFDEATMLVGLVEAAIKWIKAGLPLRKLKIVLYAKVAEGKVVSMNMRDPEGILRAFADLKEHHNKSRMIPLAVPLEYDIYLSHSTKDMEIASVVEAKLQASKPDIRIYKGKQVLDEGSFWQEDMYKTMSRCARVVPILSPAYLESKACIDLYNMALCCNRRAQRDLLAPLYIESIRDMPTYMGLVQYIDCSPKDEAKISNSCEYLVKSLEHSSMKVHTEMVMADASPLHYDIFVSYSHQDSRHAAHIVDKLQKLNPDLRIFFDIQELKAGTAWQRTLYHAIDGCRSFVCLVSNSYMKSAMCLEEFNLALAKHCSLDSTLRFIPICIEPLIEPRPEFLQVKLINATPGVFEPAMDLICSSLVDWIAGRDWHPKLDVAKTVVDAKSYAVERRRLKFLVNYGKGENILKRDDVKYPPSLKQVYCPDPDRGDDEPCDVTFSCAPEDKKFVMFMTRILHEVSPGLVIKETADTENERLALMESACKVVVFLSANYLESMEQVEEFHTVLLRQRYRSPTQVFFPITLHNLPHLPTYFHLVPCEFNLFDPLWMDLYTKHKIGPPSDLEDLRRVSRGNANSEVERYASIGIIAAVHSLLEQLKTESENPPPPKTTHQPMLLNVMLLHAEVDKLLMEVRAADEAADSKHASQHETDGGSGDNIKRTADTAAEIKLLNIIEHAPDPENFARRGSSPEEPPASSLTHSSQTGDGEIIEQVAAEVSQIEDPEPATEIPSGPAVKPKGEGIQSSRSDGPSNLDPDPEVNAAESVNASVKENRTQEGKVEDNLKSDFNRDGSPQRKSSSGELQPVVDEPGTISLPTTEAEGPDTVIESAQDNPTQEGKIEDTPQSDVDRDESPQNCSTSGEPQPVDEPCTINVPTTEAGGQDTGPLDQRHGDTVNSKEASQDPGPQSPNENTSSPNSQAHSKVAETDPTVISTKQPDDSSSAGGRQAQHQKDPSSVKPAVSGPSSERQKHAPRRTLRCPCNFI